VGFFAGPVWGMVADRYRVHKRLLLWTTLITLAAMQLQYAVAPHHAAIALLVVVAAIFSAPVCVSALPTEGLPLSRRLPQRIGQPGACGGDC
jgi:MFS family permease